MSVAEYSDHSGLIVTGTRLCCEKGLGLGERGTHNISAPANTVYQITELTQATHLFTS